MLHVRYGIVYSILQFFAQVVVFKMGNKLDIKQSLKAEDGFECHGLKYPPSYTTWSDYATNKERGDRNIYGESRIIRKRFSTHGSDDWLHFDYPIDNIVLSGGGSKGYAFVGALKVRACYSFYTKIKERD